MKQKKTNVDIFIDQLNMLIDNHEAFLTYCEVVGALELVKSDIIQEARRGHK